jgi:hypothetical protein
MRNFLFSRASAVTTHSAAYVGSLAALTADASPEVREVVCASFGTLAETSIALIWPHIKPIMEYTYACLGAPEPRLAVAACDFWDVLADLMHENEHTVEVSGVVVPALSRLVPLLMARLVMTEADYAQVAAIESERAEDVRPHIYRSRGGAHGGGATAEEAAGGGAAAAGAAAAADDEEGDDDDADGDDVHGEVSSYTPRRACAATLDVLAIAAGHEFMMPVLLPELKRCVAGGGRAAGRAAAPKRTPLPRPLAAPQISLRRWHRLGGVAHARGGGPGPGDRRAGLQ